MNLSDYEGKLTFSCSNDNVQIVPSLSGVPGRYSIIGVNFGTTTITVTDAAGKFCTLSVDVYGLEVTPSEWSGSHKKNMRVSEKRYRSALWQSALRVTESISQ